MKVKPNAVAPGAQWPHCFLDHLLVRQRLRNDAELSRRLHFTQSIISKIRRGRVRVSAEVILRVHEVFGIPIAELKQLESFRLASVASEHVNPAVRRG